MDINPIYSPNGYYTRIIEYFDWKTSHFDVVNFVLAARSSGSRPRIYNNIYAVAEMVVHVIVVLRIPKIKTRNNASNCLVLH